MAGLDAFFTVAQAAEFLSVSPNTIRNWGRDSKIPEYRHPINNYRLFKKRDLQKLLNELRNPQRGGPRRQTTS